MVTGRASKTRRDGSIPSRPASRISRDRSSRGDRTRVRFCLGRLCSCGGASRSESRVANSRIRVPLPATAPTEVNEEVPACDLRAGRSNAEGTTWLPRPPHEGPRGSNPQGKRGLFIPRRPVFQRGECREDYTHPETVVPSGTRCLHNYCRRPFAHVAERSRGSSLGS